MDSARLEYEMKKRGISIDDMCRLLNMSRTAFYRKRTGDSEFTQREIQSIMDILNIDSPMGIFFTEKVS